MSNYTVITRDTDGSDRREYKPIEKAMARFEEMAGHALADALESRILAGCAHPDPVGGEPQERP